MGVFLMGPQVPAHIHICADTLFFMDTGADTKINYTVDFEKWPLAATSFKSHPVQSNPDVTRKGLSLLPSD